MGASEVSWGGIPMILPSNLAMRYLHYERNIIPERCIEPGARYRSRRCMDENLRGYRNLKKSLQRKILDIERERKRAHHVPREPLSSVAIKNASFDENSFPRPMDRPYDHKLVAFRPYYDSVRPMYKRRIIFGNTEPRSEEFMGYMDIRRKFLKNPSEKLKELDQLC